MTRSKLLSFNMPPVAKSGMLGMLSGAGGGGAVDGIFWKKLGSTKLTGTGDIIDVSSFDEMPYLMIIIYALYTGDTNSTFTANSVTSTSYAQNNSYDGGSASSNVNRSNYTYADSSVHTGLFAYSIMENKEDCEKLWTMISNCRITSGASSIPFRNFSSGKFIPDNIITTLTHTQAGTGSYLANSEVVILGYDPADSSGDTVWEKLADVTLESPADNIDTGSFTAKKYLWVQTTCINDGTDTIYPKMTFNSNTSNYVYRFCGDGGSEVTATSQSNYRSGGSIGNSISQYSNMFICNTSTDEKFITNQFTINRSSGSGEAPYREISSGRWCNNTQITSIQLDNDRPAGNNFDTGSNITVYGFDP